MTNGVAMLFGYGPSQSLFFGLILSLSSTAIVLRLYNDRKELEAPHGNIALGILLFQDLLIVPFMLMVPLLGNSLDASVFKFLIRFLIGGGPAGIGKQFFNGGVIMIVQVHTDHNFPSGALPPNIFSLPS